MGGPIVRTGTTPAFWQNWDKVFGGTATAEKKSTGKSAAKPAAKATKAAAKPEAKATKSAKPAKGKKK